MTAPIFVLVALLTAAVVVLLVLLARSRRGEAEPAPTAPPSTERDLPSEIVSRMREGVIVLNETLTPILANDAARSILGLAPDSLPVRLRSDEMLSLARRAVAERQITETELSLWPRRINVRVRVLPLEDDRGAAIFLQDVTHEVQVQQIRRQFVVNASHELKTPVTGLLALAEAVRNALPGDVEAAERFSEQLIREAQRLSNLTRDLLDLTRVEDPSGLVAGPIDLAEIARHEVTQLKTLADDREVTLDTHIDEPVVVRGDEQQLGLMVKNLVDNAVRYSSAGGKVIVEVDREEEEGVLRVEDDGVGIPLREQSRVFERFYRVDEGRDRDSGGSGLGLSIVKHVVELHGGHVALESELGEGSTFTVRLPLVTHAA